MILIELAPLTPESPSSTLSWMYCEKLKSMPTNSLANSSCSWSISFSLVSPAGHSSNGFNGTKNSALKKPAASLPLSGRPCWETTVTTSGWRSRISRILLTNGMPASSDMVGGMVARIHRLPSSSVGRNSLPSREPTKTLTRRKTPPIAIVILRCCAATSAAPACIPDATPRTTIVSTSAQMLRAAATKRGRASR